YLKNCRHQVRAHFEWIKNRPELVGYHNEEKHHNIVKRMKGRAVYDQRRFELYTNLFWLQDCRARPRCSLLGVLRLVY
ncbi:MAG: hypothetical protein LUE89_09195, partial [Clostridiales bacterium]|nr:hypothetical protein [Clostridiales bacterium]